MCSSDLFPSHDTRCAILRLAFSAIDSVYSLLITHGCSPFSSLNTLSSVGSSHPIRTLGEILSLPKMVSLTVTISDHLIASSDVVTCWDWFSLCLCVSCCNWHDLVFYGLYKFYFYCIFAWNTYSRIY